MKDLFRNRRFTLLWAGQSVSTFGDWLRTMALTFWVYEVSGRSPVATAAVMVAEYLPKLLLAPLAGVLADRWPRGRTMFWTQVVSSAVSLSFLVALKGRSLAFTVLLAFLGSAVSQLYNPARNAMIPMIVERERLVGANSLSQVTANLGLTLGPVLGTAVYFSLGPRWSFVLDAVSFLVVAGAIRWARLPDGELPGNAPTVRALVREFKYGLGHVLRNRSVLTAGLASCLVMLGGGVANVCDLYLITRDLGLSEAALSVVISVQGVAMVVASLSVLTWSRRLRSGRPLISSGMATVGVALAGMGLSPNLGWVLFWSAVLGVGNSVGAIGVATVLQADVEPSLRGRVAGAINPAVIACALAGTGAAGVLARHMSVRPIMAVAGLVAVLAGLAAYLGFRAERG